MRVLPAAILTLLLVAKPMRRLFNVVFTSTGMLPTAEAMLTLSVGAAKAMVLAAEVKLE